MQKIQVNHEWGSLKEVLVGIPYVKLPDWLPKSVYHYTPSEGIRFAEVNLGRTLEEADPELYRRAVQQLEAAVKILEDLGVKVHILPFLEKTEQEYLSAIFPASAIQFFPRDPVLVIGNHVIETELLFPYRRRERFAIRRALSDRLSDSNAEYVAMPPAVPEPEDDQGNWGPGPFLEGGDVLLLGRDIYVGVSGNASNLAGVQWLAQYLGPSYNVIPVRLEPKFLHLDCCLSTPRPGLAIICRDAFLDGLPEFLKDWRLIELPFEEAKEMLGCNGLVLDDKTIMIHTDLPNLSKELRAAGQEVIETPFDAVYIWAGAFRCWHHPLVRESSL